MVLAGLAGFGGGVIAWATGGDNTETKPEVTHGIIAFGGGILIAAGAGDFFLQDQTTLTANIMTFAAGGMVFSYFKTLLRKRRSENTGYQRSAQFWVSRLK